MEHTHDDHKEPKKQKIERDHRYWMSLEHYEQDPEFMAKAEQEFASSPLREEKEEGWARREFMKLMGASVALTTASCIRRPVQKIVPYNKQPEDVTFGVYNHYTSTVRDGLESVGVLVRTRDGRPLKIEGNPDNPLQMGATTARVQASILSLYDPDRLRGPRKNLFNEKRSNKDTISVSWDGADSTLVEQLKKGDVALLTGSTDSLTLKTALKDFCEGFKAKHFVFDPIGYQDILDGQKESFGNESLPYYSLEKAKVIVSIDADFLGSWMMPGTHSKQFGRGRKDIKNMSRLVVFDSNYSLTGANADIRYRIKPSQQLPIALALITELGGELPASLKSAANQAIQSNEGTFSREDIKSLAKTLTENRGEAVVLSGGTVTQTENAASLQIAVNYLNHLIGAVGKTVFPGAMGVNLGSEGSLGELIAGCTEGKYKTLIIHGTNPMYALPHADWATILKPVEMIVTTSTIMDEVADHSHLILPASHPCETWSDAEPVAGLHFLHQPTIREMYDTRSIVLSLMSWCYIAKVGPSRIQSDDIDTDYKYQRLIWKDSIYSRMGGGLGFEDFWSQALQKGYVGQVDPRSSSSFSDSSVSKIKMSEPSTASGGFELVLYPTVQMGDGQNTNNSWLWELPDPVTKIVWDNYVSLSPAKAKQMNLQEGSVAEIQVAAIKMKLPVHIQPGLHDGVAAVAIGYGREKGGRIASGQGKNAYAMVGWQERPVMSGAAVTVTAVAGEKNELANVQGHHSMEGRQIVVEATVAEYSKNPGANIQKHKIWNLWPGHAYNGHKWAMSVDLNSCTGCSACTVACQSENNIPVVGKKYVIQGREMHWIRVDRYYTGSPENAETVFQPVMCQHCDNAPCETVCPILATTHGDEGTNDMTYNRCVGTRYCSNNCPYKVRRFNYFNFTGKTEKPLTLAYNPDVTVRSRGVMEKCTFCIQRIKAGKNKAKLAGVPLKDGDIKTACQTACPTEAIVFGDMNDPESKVAQVFKAEPRAYALLEEWHAAPSVRYLSKIRNNGKETMARDGNEAPGKQGEHS